MENLGWKIIVGIFVVENCCWKICGGKLLLEIFWWKFWWNFLDENSWSNIFNVVWKMLVENVWWKIFGGGKSLLEKLVEEYLVETFGGIVLEELSYFLDPPCKKYTHTYILPLSSHADSR